MAGREAYKEGGGLRESREARGRGGQRSWRGKDIWEGEGRTGKGQRNQKGRGPEKQG